MKTDAVHEMIQASVATPSHPPPEKKKKKKALGTAVTSGATVHYSSLGLPDDLTAFTLREITRASQ